MNQASSIGFGVDATVMSGYAQAANARLGAVDFVFENTGANTLYVKVMQFDGVTSPSGFINTIPLGTSVASFLVVPRGVITKSFNLLSKRIGFFGSGNTAADGTGSAASTTANVSAVLRNKSDLRGGQIDITPIGRKGWGYDDGFNKAELQKKWGSVSASGVIDPNGTTL